MKELSFEVRTVIKVKVRGSEHQELGEVQFLLLPPPEVDSKMYFDKEDRPTKDAMSLIATILIQGLVANINYGKSTGRWEPEDHIRQVLKELERAYTQLGKAEGELGVYVDTLAEERNTAHQNYWQWLYLVTGLGYIDQVVFGIDQESFLRQRWAEGYSPAQAYKAYTDTHPINNPSTN